MILLKTAPLFSQTPAEVLAHIAGLLEEVACKGGELVLRQGDPRACLYIRMTGKVKAHALKAGPL